VNELERSRAESENRTSRPLRTLELLERPPEPEVMLRERPSEERESNRGEKFDRFSERPDEIFERAGELSRDRELPADDRSEPLREKLLRLLSKEREARRTNDPRKSARARRKKVRGTSRDRHCRAMSR
jgi:hypothetical protein